MSGMPGMTPTSLAATVALRTGLVKSLKMASVFLLQNI